jgi:hypothetical protein
MRHVSVLVVLFSLLLLSAVSRAQQPATSAVPNLIRYSAKLKDASGAALPATTVGVTFSIYKQQDGGAPVWMETQNVTTDANGNYNVTFQSGIAASAGTIGNADVSGALGTMYYSIPFPIHAAAGTSIAYQAYQAVASNCVTPPVITIRPAPAVHGILSASLTLRQFQNGVFGRGAEHAFTGC